MDKQLKYLLDESQIPDHWVNIAADLPGEPLPPLNPGTGQPLGPEDLAPLFPMGLIEQEVSMEPQIDIPEEVVDKYRLWRPTPLFRARRLREGARHPGPHLLQVRRSLPGRIPQAQQRDPAGLVQQAGGREEARRPRPAPASGAPRSRSPARCSVSNARSSWSAPATTRSRTAGR